MSNLRCAGMAGPACNPEAGKSAAAAIIRIMQHLRQQLPDAHLIILGLLPKGLAWPNLCTPVLSLVNDRLADASANDKKMIFLDISHKFLVFSAKAAGTQEISEILMPDTLHPGHRGMQVIS